MSLIGVATPVTEVLAIDKVICATLLGGVNTAYSMIRRASEPSNKGSSIEALRGSRGISLSTVEALVFIETVNPSPVTFLTLFRVAGCRSLVFGAGCLEVTS